MGVIESLPERLHLESAVLFQDCGEFVHALLQKRAFGDFREDRIMAGQTLNCVVVKNVDTGAVEYRHKDCVRPARDCVAENHLRARR